MPAARDRNDKHYGGIAPAGSNNEAGCVRVTPENPRRTMLFIQNTGTNAGLVRFEEPIQGDGSDMLFVGGSGILWDRADTVPQSAINVGSLLGTTFAVIEQVGPPQ